MYAEVFGQITFANQTITAPQQQKDPSQSRLVVISGGANVPRVSGPFPDFARRFAEEQLEAGDGGGINKVTGDTCG
jgi:hypothetical protein